MPGRKLYKKVILNWISDLTSILQFLSSGMISKDQKFCATEFIFNINDFIGIWAELPENQVYAFISL